MTPFNLSLNGKNLVCFPAPSTLGPSSMDPGHRLRSGTLSPRIGGGDTSFIVPLVLLLFYCRHDSRGCACESSDPVDVNSFLVTGPLHASSSRWASLPLRFKPLCWYVDSCTTWCVTIPRLPQVLRRRHLNPASIPWQPAGNHRYHEGRRRRRGCAPVIPIRYVLNYVCSG
jgi:hypothetical protein